MIDGLKQRDKGMCAMWIENVGRFFCRAAAPLALCMVLASHPPQAAASPLLQSGEPHIDAVSDELENLYKKQFLPKLVKQLSSAVVNISVESKSAPREKAGREEGAAPGIPSNPFRSAGSGFIVRSDGYIVTCNHVIEGAERIIVRLLEDREEYPAQVIGRDPKTDLALLKIKSSRTLTSVYVGDSDSVQVGEWVVAIGNQFQLGQTVTSGIVSAKARKVPTRGTPYDSFIQTDASINPGSSGGPLFNLRGQVVGVNSAIFSPGQAQLGGPGFNIGIGFAVPVNLLKQIIGEMESTGTVARGMLGVRIQPVDKSIQKVLKLGSTTGALVSEVIKDTPASVAGVRRRDVITHFDSTPIEEFDQLPLLVANARIGSPVTLTLIRKGKKMTVDTVVGALKPEVTVSRPKSNEIASQIGLSVEDLTEIQARALGIDSVGGVFVRAVLQDSAADRAGITKGDIIEEIGEVTIENGLVLEKVLSALPAGERVLVAVRRLDGSRILTLEMPGR